MGIYAAMPYEQLVLFINSANAGAVEAAADGWKTSAESADSVNGELTARATEVKPFWQKQDGQAFGDTLDGLSTYAKQIGDDAGDMHRGLKQIAAAITTAQAAAAPIIAVVEASSPLERAAKELAAQPGLAAIMETMAAVYQTVMGSMWHSPKPAPRTFPNAGDGAVSAANAAVDAASTASGDSGESSAPGYDDSAVDSTGAYDGHADDGMGYSGSSPTDSGLAGTGVGGAASPVSAGGVATAAPSSGGGMGGGMGAGPASGLAAAGMGTGGGMAGGASGERGRPAAKASSSNDPNRGLFGGAPMGAAGAPSQGDDGEGDHTWLTEDEMVWTRDDSAPVVIGSGSAM
ncbi:MAG TPA: hypothetical protein VE172_19045 [Stackebrandtia sp.]|jgi:uncharacterized protein YukE|uniref:hypothetical protein n=1 Tax=Stackebrandtia sp. TaxID=2023065 RepID=UPI002D5C7F00|nr:hypothetical protein [Stackebrandtia sp.]HZE40900.1 hypothetical protein [Stackebrandtia sp.]